MKIRALLILVLPCTAFLLNAQPEVELLEQYLLEQEIPASRLWALPESAGGIGSLYGELGALLPELSYLPEASELYDEIAFTYNPEQLSALFRKAGALFYRQGKYTQAIDILEKSLSPLRRQRFLPGKQQELADAYLMLGRAYLSNGEPEGALKTAQSALEDMSYGSNPGSWFTFPPVEGYFQPARALPLLELKSEAFASLYHRNGKREDAEGQLNSLEHSMAVLERARPNYLSESYQLEWGHSLKKLQARAMGLAEQLHREYREPAFAERAFTLSEKARASLLREKFTRLRQAGDMAERKAMVQKEEKLKMELAYLRSRKESADADTIAPLEAALLETRRRLDNLMGSPPPSPATEISALQEALGAEAAIVEYFWADTMVFIFTITRDAFLFSKEQLTPGLRDAIFRMRQAAESRAYEADAEGALESLCQTGHFLYQKLLLGPALASLRQHPRKLLIIPDGPLWQLPFDALLTALPERPTSRNLPYLLKSVTISYGYSAGLLLAGQLNDGQAELAPAIFAPVFSEAWAAYGACTSRGALHYSLEEAKTIQAATGGALFLNETATKQGFLEQLAQRGQAHLATHTCIDEHNPMASTLLLADEALPLYEIYSAGLSARMVVLSACHTADGPDYQGEALLGFGYGFARAGCPTLVLSLWEASDRPAAQLMEFFYRELGLGYTSPEALRRAKLRFLEQASPEFLPPFFWSGFIHLGQPQAFKTSGKSATAGFYLAGALLFGITILYITKKANA